VSVWDDDPIKDDLIGEAQIPLFSVERERGPREFSLIYQGKLKSKQTGIITLEASVDRSLAGQPLLSGVRAGIPSAIPASGVSEALAGPGAAPTARSWAGPGSGVGPAGSVGSGAGSGMGPGIASGLGAGLGAGALGSGMGSSGQGYQQQGWGQQGPQREGWGQQGGNLNVRVVSVQGLENKEVFTKNDPYVVLKVGKERRTTHTRNSAGRAAEFNETFSFPLTGSIRDGALHVSVWDDDPIKDDFIGELDIPFSELERRGPQRFELLHKKALRKDKPAGYITLDANFGDQSASGLAPSGITSESGLGSGFSDFGSGSGLGSGALASSLPPSAAADAGSSGFSHPQGYGSGPQGYGSGPQGYGADGWRGSGMSQPQQPEIMFERVSVARVIPTGYGGDDSGEVRDFSRGDTLKGDTLSGGIGEKGFSERRGADRDISGLRQSDKPYPYADESRSEEARMRMQQQPIPE